LRKRSSDGWLDDEDSRDDDEEGGVICREGECLLAGEEGVGAGEAPEEETDEEVGEWKR
jgi:hypothetical protein